ncbi:MAG TPA: glycine cleavage system protein GcvH [Mycobacteriales bacterium]
MIPADLLYTREHEWVRREGDVLRVGITDYAQQALGDVVFVQQPAVGDALTAGAPCGEIESTKSVSDLFAPVDGTVEATNEALAGSPELVNSAPYDEGWILSVRLRAGAEPTGLLTAEEYEQHIGA